MCLYNSRTLFINSILNNTRYSIHKRTLKCAHTNIPINITTFTPMHIPKFNVTSISLPSILTPHLPYPYPNSYLQHIPTPTPTPTLTLFYLNTPLAGISAGQIPTIQIASAADLDLACQASIRRQRHIYHNDNSGVSKQAVEYRIDVDAFIGELDGQPINDEVKEAIAKVVRLGHRLIS